MTEGDTTEQAYEMAADALGLAITDRMKNNEELPTASEATDTLTDDDGVLILAGGIDGKNCGKIVGLKNRKNTKKSSVS